MVTRRNLLGATGALGLLGLLSGCSVTKQGTGLPSPTDLPTPSQTPTPTPTPTLPVGEPLPEGLVNVLVLGSDSRTHNLDEDAHSDVITLVQLTPNREHLNMVSVPRDTYTQLQTGGYAKINDGFVYGGAAGMAWAVGNLLKVPVHYTMETGFHAFNDAISMLGGITVYNRIASDSFGSVFSEGWIPLDTSNALNYVRERYGLPNGDLDRTERHRATLTGIAARIGELAREDAFAVLEQVPSWWNTLRVGGLSVEHAIGLIKTAKSYTHDSVSSTMLPIAYFDMVNGQSVNRVNDWRLSQLIAQLQAGDISAYVAEDGMNTSPR